MKTILVLCLVALASLVPGNVGQDRTLTPPPSRLLAPFFKERFGIDQVLGIEGPHISEIRSFGEFVTGDLSDDFDEKGPRRSGGWLLEQFAAGEKKNFYSFPAVCVFSLLRGGPIDIHIIEPVSGELTTTTLGGKKDGFVAVIPAGHISALKVRKGDVFDFRFALFSLVTTPEIRADDLNFIRRDDLLRRFPQHRDKIIAFTDE
ncbi:uncharacterized protein LOC143452188 [Clavelina lepadiformis]|uniref:Uncharacterized protein n=1 Tax=Clavelina lepadiformis TaxID=159417 RepID=A0ABP0GYU4_CLALP